MRVASNPRHRLSFPIKRTLDCVLALPRLVFAAPLCALAMPAIEATQRARLTRRLFAPVERYGAARERDVRQ